MILIVSPESCVLHCWLDSSCGLVMCMWWYCTKMRICPEFSTWRGLCLPFVCLSSRCLCVCLLCAYICLTVVWKIPRRSLQKFTKNRAQTEAQQISCTVKQGNPGRTGRHVREEGNSIMWLVESVTWHAVWMGMWQSHLYDLNRESTKVSVYLVFRITLKHHQ